MDRRFNSRSISVVQREDGGNRLVGYGAVFYRSGDAGTEYELPGGIFERIDRHAFRSAIGRDDVRGLFNHDPSLLLGRSGAGTLRLQVDDMGLRYEIDLPNTTVANDVAESIMRGDVTGSSFAFAVTDQEIRKDGEKRVRLLKDLRVYDVGPVTYPAYEGTSVGVRSAEDCQEAREAVAWFDRQETLRRREIAVRARMVQLENEAVGVRIGVGVTIAKT
jgi:HK97 family phage prohead protease